MANWGKDFEKRKVLRQEWKTPRERSTSRPGSEHDDGEELRDDERSNWKRTWRVGGCLLHKWGAAYRKERAVCDFENAGVNWRLKKSDQCRYIAIELLLRKTEKHLYSIQLDAVTVLLQIIMKAWQYVQQADWCSNNSYLYVKRKCTLTFTLCNFNM